MFGFFYNLGKDFIAFFGSTGLGNLTPQMCIMWGICLLLFYLGIYKKFEPLLLIPIAFGGLLANLPAPVLMHEPPGPIITQTAGTFLEWQVKLGDEVKKGKVLATVQPASGGAPVEIKANTDGFVTKFYTEPGASLVFGESIMNIYSNDSGGLFYYIYKGIQWEIFPPIIFLGVGALTDFGPLIARPITMLLGAAAQLGIVATFMGATFLGFTNKQAASIGIIGGADGPTTIFITSKLAPEILPIVAVAAYSYMALVPLIQPPIMTLLTTKKERLIRMKSLRPVSRLEKMTFAVFITIAVILLAPEVAPLISMLMLGNLLRECGVVERLVKACQNEVINVCTIFLGLSVGITMTSDLFLKWDTLMIILLGLVSFGLSTAGGVLMAKFLNLFLHDKINPLIGSAGVSAMPMAARVSQNVGQKADPHNFLLMHAMGPNVSGTIGTAVLVGYYLATLPK